jgi:hypothetical protein
MNIADTIRRYENDALMNQGTNVVTGADSSDDATTIQKYFSNFIHPMISKVRNFWETPGIQAGCITAGCCIIPVIPLRRSVLHYMNHSMNLGSTFPDLVFTPAITMLVAQCSVYVGTCYGVIHYLNQISSTPSPNDTKTESQQKDVKPGCINNSVIHSICHDPILIEATNILKCSPHLSSSPSFVRHYDLRDRVTTALHSAVQACQMRRDLEK